METELRHADGSGAADPRRAAPGAGVAIGRKPRLDRCLSMYGVHPLMRWGVWPAPAGVPILMYHSVSDDPEVGVRPYYRLAISPALFRSHLRVLREEGYEVVSLGAAAEAVAGSSGWAGRLAVITFDDGFRDFLTQAWPVLEEYSYPATVFLPTAFIGRERSVFNGRECLVWEEVKALRRAGVTFGSHTVNHPRLAALGDREFHEELAGSKRVLESELGEAVDSFSHPYAFPLAEPGYVDRFRAGLVQAGYRVAVTTTVGRARRGADPLLLSRLPANGADDPEFLRVKLRGAYDWLAGPQAAVKRMKGLCGRGQERRASSRTV